MVVILWYITTNTSFECLKKLKYEPVVILQVVNRQQ